MIARSGGVKKLSYDSWGGAFQGEEVKCNVLDDSGAQLKAWTKTLWLEPGSQGREADGL